MTESIDRIEADAVVTQDGRRHPVDALILATGFNLWQKGNFPAFEVIGTKGVEMGEQWRNGSFRSFEGLTVPGFPNLFNLHSPYSYTGFCYFNAIEIQMQHMERCLSEMQRRKAKRFEVTEAAQERFMQKMRRNSKNTVLVAGNCASANSYYFNQHGEASLLRLTSTRSGMSSAREFPLDAYVFRSE